MIQTLLLILMSVLSTAFAILFYDQRKKNIQILANTIEFFILQEQENQQTKTDKDQANEDFLKFISESRDWAYTYIDEVQESLNRFITEIEPEISYFDEYGVIGSAYPHYYSMKKISTAYKELKKLLPEDYGKIDT